MIPQLLSLAAVIALAGCCDRLPEPPQTIIILADHHFVSRDDFGADIQSQHAEPVPDENIDLQYAAFLRNVESIQREQIVILRDAIAEHGIRAVFVEGVTAANLDAFRARVQELAATPLAALEARLESDDFGERALAAR